MAQLEFVLVLSILTAHKGVFYLNHIYSSIDLDCFTHRHGFTVVSLHVVWLPFLLIFSWLFKLRIGVSLLDVQCFKSRDDNFSSNYFISKGQFQTDFSQLLVDPKFLNSYGGQYMTSIAPHKSCNKLDKPWAEKSASEKLPILTKNCRL